MFISQLKDKLLAYDQFGEHRTNGIKALFVLELMIVFNFYSSMVNPYFFYFYAPLTCFTAEITGNTLEEKYLFLFFTLIGSALSIFLFEVFSTYKTFFVFFAFFYSMALYFIVLQKLPKMMVVVPIILSLAAYSLIYNTPNSGNFYVALNHALQVLAATGVIFIALYLFPKKRYFVIWQRAFIEVIHHLESFTAKILRAEVQTVAISSGTIAMARYSKMLPRTIKYLTVLRLTLLAFELVQGMSYMFSFHQQIEMKNISVLHHYLEALLVVCKKHQPLPLNLEEQAAFNDTHELRILYKLILSWNYLCAHYPSC
jgi:hypothetical protein